MLILFIIFNTLLRFESIMSSHEEIKYEPTSKGDDGIDYLLRPDTIQRKRDKKLASKANCKDAAGTKKVTCRYCLKENFTLKNLPAHVKKIHELEISGINRNTFVADED